MESKKQKPASQVLFRTRIVAARAQLCVPPAPSWMGNPQDGQKRGYRGEGISGLPNGLHTPVVRPSVGRRKLRIFLYSVVANPQFSAPTSHRYKFVGNAPKPSEQFCKSLISNEFLSQIDDLFPGGYRLHSKFIWIEKHTFPATIRCTDGAP
jgi:hypothetical protein